MGEARPRAVPTTATGGPSPHQGVGHVQFANGQRPPWDWAHAASAAVEAGTAPVNRTVTTLLSVVGMPTTLSTKVRCWFTAESTCCPLKKTAATVSTPAITKSRLRLRRSAAGNEKPVAVYVKLSLAIHRCIHVLFPKFGSPIRPCASRSVWTHPTSQCGQAGPMSR